MRDYLFTSESVSEGHPDKMADQISDAVLDAIIAKDPMARVACETMVNTGLVVLAGEITAKETPDYQAIARDVVKEIGYDSSEKGFDYNTCSVMTTIDRQSPDIAMGVDRNDPDSQGAGDQGIMFGYATNETPELMPATIALSHRIVKEMAVQRKSGSLGFLRPDSKSQVTIEYVDGKPKRVRTVVVSTQHDEDVTQEKIREAVIDSVIKNVVPAELMDANTEFKINPTGRFVIGGPQGDCGLTGRKIIVDTYGGHGAHGGGAFSGKDPSKVDRSAAYVTRHIAKNIVAAGLAEQCLVQVAYAIGVADPVSIYVNDYGTGKVAPEVIEKAIPQVWSLKPNRLIQELDLLRPIYRPTAAYGHFGRSEESFSWEKTDKVEALKNAIG